MAEVFLQKLNGVFVPAYESDREVAARVKGGAVVRCQMTQPRNIKFHRKFFAMVNLGFEAWEPPEQEFRGLPVQKNPKRFRKDCIIAAGYYDVVSNLKGEVRAEAKSISFANMGEEEFNQLYSAVANVILQRALTSYTRDDLDRVVEQILMF